MGYDSSGWQSVIGLALIGLFFGAMILFTRRPATTYTAPYHSGNVKIIADEQEPRRYRNKETRNIEYNSDGLPIKIEIIRDYAIT